METLQETLTKGKRGILPDAWIRDAIDSGFVRSDWAIPAGSIQPASLDLRLGEVAYRLQCSFLPEGQRVVEKLKDFSMGSIDLRDGAILEPNRPYLIPLMEQLRLPEQLSGKANPKSSTGRVDVFTRVITDRSSAFDEVSAGYRGQLFVEVVSRSFTVYVREGLSLNQLRIGLGQHEVTDLQLFDLHRDSPLLYLDNEPIETLDMPLGKGLFLSLELNATGDQEWIGYRARRNSPLLDLTAVHVHDWKDFWDPVFPVRRGGLILEPEEFYLLLSKEAVVIPPTYAAEMVAYDPTSGELRTHYAGFFDPGFGWGKVERGSRAALEVRAHDVPFMVESGQRVCRLQFERLAEQPKAGYGAGIGSSYQHQVETLSKHFRPSRAPVPRQLELPIDGT